MASLKRFRFFENFSGDAWRFYFELFKGHRRKILQFALVAAGQTILIIPSLLLVKYAFDIVIPDNNIHLLILIGVAIFLLRLANSGISVYLRRRQINIINQSVFVLRKKLIRRLYNLSYTTYLRSDIRSLHTRIVQDSERLTNMSTALISRLLPSGIISIGLVAVCLWLNWYLLLLIVMLSPLLVVSNKMMGRPVKSRVVLFQKAFEEFSKGVYFVLRYLPLTTLQSAQDTEVKRQEKVLDDLRHKTGSMADIFSINLQLQETLTGFTAIVIIIAGGISVAQGYMSLGDFLSFYLAAMYLNKNINIISSSVPDLIAGNVSLNTLYDFEHSEASYEHKGTKELIFAGDLEMSDVHFSYGDRPLLRGVNLRLRPGVSTAIIGRNGAGKTTILNLIVGLIVPGSGTLSASGHRYEEIDIQCFRRQIGIVPQNPQLFPGTIAENVTYGHDHVDENRIREVLALATADGFVQQLPDGINTSIGDDGVQLSGGEAQRIAIARALYGEPKLLILDEPTNHLDSIAVAECMTKIGALSSKPSILVISHDKEVIGFADEVYHLENGVLHHRHEN